MTDLKLELLRRLQMARADLLSTLDGLGEYDIRRPVTASGTNLLGLVKHVIGNEHGYLGGNLGRPAPDPLPWVEDGTIWDGADMWVLPDESREYIVGLYERTCAHSDKVVAELDLDAPAHVPHWPEERRATTLGVLLVRMVGETAQHAGHANVVREMIDGRGGPDRDSYGDETYWTTYVGKIQAAADPFRGAP